MTDGEIWEVGEPAVDELLSDPIMAYLLRRDGLTRRDVWRAVESARDKLRAGAPALSGAGLAPPRFRAESLAAAVPASTIGR